jgi:hypothetical protein
MPSSTIVAMPQEDHAEMADRAAARMIRQGARLAAMT